MDQGPNSPAYFNSADFLPGGLREELRREIRQKKQMRMLRPVLKRRGKVRPSPQKGSPIPETPLPFKLEAPRLDLDSVGVRKEEGEFGFRTGGSLETADVQRAWVVRVPAKRQKQSCKASAESPSER